MVAKFYSIREPEESEPMKPLIVQFSLSTQQLHCSAIQCNKIQYNKLYMNKTQSECNFRTQKVVKIPWQVGSDYTVQIFHPSNPLYLLERAEGSLLSL